MAETHVMHITYHGKTVRISEPTLGAVLMALYELGLKVSPEVLAQISAPTKAA